MNHVRLGGVGPRVPVVLSQRSRPRLRVRPMLRENGAPLDSKINFGDIGKVVDAFKTIAYAEDGPTSCP